jgi:hypothetical protein
MRRRAYPYGRYLIKGKKVDILGSKLKTYMETLEFPIIKYDTKNEDKGTLIIAVNKKIKDFIMQKKPSGRIEMILSGFQFDVPSLRETDVESQRVGIELYLWPIDKGTLLEIFVLPYIEHFNRPEIYGLTQSQVEEITDWYLCEQIWEHIIPQIESEFDMEPVHRRA